MRDGYLCRTVHVHTRNVRFIHTVRYVCTYVRVRTYSYGAHAAAIYGAETLAVSPPYGGSNAPATIFISVTATPWKWELAEWEPSLSPSRDASRVALARMYYPGNSPSFAWPRRFSFSLSLSLYVPFVRSYIHLLPHLFPRLTFFQFPSHPPRVSAVCLVKGMYTFARVRIHVHYVGQAIVIDVLACVEK